jgi:PAS domain S-box-containing protein
MNGAFLQQMIDAMPDGVRVIGTDYRILMVNAAYGHQLGVTPETAVGEFCYASSHKLDSPCSPTLVTCPLVELQGERHALKCRHRHLTSEGSEVFVEVSAARAQLDQDGRKADLVIEVIRDLAEQVQVSHQYRLAEIGQFAAGIAHEIHTPLSSIHLALTAIESEARTLAAADRIAGYIETANREIDRCISVTNRLLRISEPPSDDLSLVDITAVLRDVADLVAYEAGEAKVAIVLDAAENTRTLGNEADMASIALNIVQNAIHAMPKGGTLTIRASRSGSKIRVSFHDTGVGIAPENMQRIFWPFWSRRADGSLGSGLGLSICRAAAERMHGKLWLESTLGAGTSFHLELPSADEPEESA